MKMARFLWKGVMRDRRRSLLPVIVVSIGVFVIVFMDGFMGGMLSGMLRLSARFESGHLKVMTRAYNIDADQKPIDLAILDAGDMIWTLQKNYSSVDWCPRIYFGGLLDIPDEQGETRAQGPVSGTAYDLLNPSSREAERMRLREALVEGRLIEQPTEVLVSYDFAERFDVNPGDELTFFGSTMYGSMSFTNLTVAGILRFGMGSLDRGAIIVDLTDARSFLDMADATGEIFGFLPDDAYDYQLAEDIKTSFNAGYTDADDEFAPIMLQLTDQNGMGDMLAYTDIVSIVMLLLLMLALSIVLWNTGVLSGIRRYNEFGVRLAMGEEKGHLFRSMLTESLFIGLIGSIIGTTLGILFSWYLKVYGLSYGDMVDNLSIMIDPVVRSSITPRMFVIGFIPGLFSMLIGTALAGIAIYKRNTAVLFKELE